MKKLLGLTVAASVLLTACGKTETVTTGGTTDTGATQTITANVPDCVFPDAPTTAAPGWVCDEPVMTPNGEFYQAQATGSYEKTGAGYNFQKQQAAAAARVLLAQEIRSQVSNMVKQFAKTTGAMGSETVDRVNESVTMQITDESLSSTRIVKSRPSPNGYLYVVVAMTEEAFAEKAQAAIKTSMNNDQALWQEFQAEKGHESLSDELMKYREMKGQ